MSNFNQVGILGNLCFDPDIANTTSGLAVLKFTLAVNSSRKNHKTGEYEDSVSFIPCTLFGNRANGLHKVLKKGAKIIVSGELKSSHWEKDGEKRSKIEVIARDIEILYLPKGDGIQQDSNDTTNESSSLTTNDIAF